MLLEKNSLFLMNYTYIRNIPVGLAYNDTLCVSILESLI